MDIEREGSESKVEKNRDWVEKNKKTERKQQVQITRK